MLKYYRVKSIIFFMWNLEFNKWPDIQKQSVWKKTEFSEWNKDFLSFLWSQWV